MRKLKASTRPCQRPKRALGFTLIEILVALVILSIGLLGIAALQLRSLQNSHASYERSIATLQAKDLVERMWARTCSLNNEDGTFDEPVAESIETVWREDHERVGTFSGQGWLPVLTVPPTATDFWTITIRWAGRSQGQEEEIVHHFRLPPRLPSCPPQP